MTIASLNTRTGIPLRYANRHGLITGATGTGKTISLMRLAEQFSAQGVPIFISDVKSDIAALARSCPVTMLDLFGAQGDKIGITFARMGADLVSRALELSDIQGATVEVAFAFARDRNSRIDTIKDFRSLLAVMSTQRHAISSHYGQVSPASIGVIQRALLRMESQGGTQFFRAPCFDIAALLQPGRVSILAAERLMQSPRLYGAFLLFMLSDLYARLPEIGDVDKPRLVFFFDEAHLLFTDCPPALLRKIEQTVRLIRSKGVGVYFVSQSVDDVPQIIREQLAHRVEHDRTLAVGTARVVTMDSNGRPLKCGVQRIDLPKCPLGALRDDERPIAAPEVAQVAIATVDHRKGLAGVVMGLGFILTPIAVIALLWFFVSAVEGRTIAIILSVLSLFGLIAHLTDSVKKGR